MAFRIELIEDKKEWEKILQNSSYTIFHHWDWLKSFEQASGYTFEPYLILHKKTPIGIFPIFTVRKYGLSFRFSPPPHSAIPFLGFTFSKFNELKQNKKEMYIRETCKAIYNLVQNSTSFSLVLIPDIIDVRPFLWEGYNTRPVYHYVLDLTLGEETILRNFKASARKSIKKSKEILEIKEGGLEELKTILNFMKNRYEEQGKSVKVPFEYIYNVYKIFKNNFQVLTAELNGEPVGGVINLLDGNKVYSWLGNTKSNISGVYPNDLLIWESIKRACQNGFKFFYEIGANTPHLVVYKSRFNPDLALCFSISKDGPVGKIAKKIYVSTNYIRFQI